MFWLSIRISLKFVTKGPFDNKPALVQVVAWRGTGGMPLPEPMMTQFSDAYMRHQGEMSLNSTLVIRQEPPVAMDYARLFVYRQWPHWFPPIKYDFVSNLLASMSSVCIKSCISIDHVALVMVISAFRELEISTFVQ